MPENGWPMKVLSTDCSMKRPPSTHLKAEVPSETTGGLEGSMNMVILARQVPTMKSSFLWAGPGVAIFIIASIMAFSSMAGAGAAFLAGEDFLAGADFFS